MMNSGANTLNNKSDKMNRSLEEAKQIVEKNFSILELPSHSVAHLLTTLYAENYSPDYCDKCFHSGIIVTIENGEVITEECSCKKYLKEQKKYKEALSKTNIPQKYHDFTIDMWVNIGRNEKEILSNKRSIQIIKNYIERIDTFRKRGYGLFICGPNGVGKTFLACEIGKAAVRAGYSVKFYTLAKIISLVLEGWYDEETRRETVRHIETCDFLIIDDCDKVYKSKSGIEVAIFDSMFRERLQWNRPVIFTSNVNSEQFSESFNHSIYSMFLETSAEVVLVGEDYRKKISEQIKKDILND